MSKTVLISRKLASLSAELLVTRFNELPHVSRVDAYVDTVLALAEFERLDLVPSLRYPRRNRPVIFVNGKQL